MAIDFIDKKADAVDSWHLERWTRFTASEDHKLVAPGASGATFSAGGLTYIEQKAMQSVTLMWERPELEEVKSLLHGKMYEYPAYQEYVNRTRNFKLTYIGDGNPIFLTHPGFEEESGGTPDVANITDIHNIDYGAEIKCPKDPMNHYRRLDWKTQWDLKENYSTCYYQIQKLIMITGAFGWDFISYDERMRVKRDKIKIIEVKPDQKFQDNFPLRLMIAIKEKYKIISQRNQAEIKNRTDLVNFFKSN